jgi:hypothetical protein
VQLVSVTKAAVKQLGLCPRGYRCYVRPTRIENTPTSCLSASASISQDVTLFHAVLTLLIMTQSPRRRRRPALSCLDCRRRKIKCDRNDPCMNCTSSGLQCKYKRFSRGPSTAAQVDIEVIPSVDDPASTSSSHHAARFHAPLTPARSHNESRDAGADNLRPRQSVPHTASSQAQASAIRQDAYTAGRPSLGPSLHSREPQPAITVEDRQCFDQQPPTTNVFQPLSGIAKEILEPSPGQQTSLMNLKDIRHPTGNPSAQDTHIV